MTSVGHAKVFKYTLGVDAQFLDYLVERLARFINWKDREFRKNYTCQWEGFNYLLLSVDWLLLLDYLQWFQGCFFKNRCQLVFSKMMSWKLQCEWWDITTQIAKRWNFPHTLDALDGKHKIIINHTKVARSCLLFFIYRRYFSILMLAFVYEYMYFKYVEVGGKLLRCRNI